MIHHVNVDPMANFQIADGKVFPTEYACKTAGNAMLPHQMAQFMTGMAVHVANELHPDANDLVKDEFVRDVMSSVAENAIPPFTEGKKAAFMEGVQAVLNPEGGAN